MADIITINLAKEFSPTPLGRTRAQGRYSGEAFREDFLRPALERFSVVVVDLDGASGLSTGFLDEAFAGLVRRGYVTLADFSRRVRVIANRDPAVLDEIMEFVSRATPSEQAD